MNDTFTRLLANVPGVDKSANNVNSVTLSGSGTVSLQNNALYISTSTTSATVDLNGISVSQIIPQLPSGVTATLYQNGMAELLTLPNAVINASLPVTLEIATSDTWIVVETIARSFDANRQSLSDKAAQLNLFAATSKILDWWGASVNLPRFLGEPDLLYAQRIALMKFSPNVNNVALEIFFEKMGYSAHVVDTTPSNFNVTVTLPTTTSSAFSYTLDQLQAALNILKAAGTIASIFVQGALEDTVVMTDIVTAQLTSNAWTWGAFTWGQFNW